MRAFGSTITTLAIAASMASGSLTDSGSSSGSGGPARRASPQAPLLPDRPPARSSSPATKQPNIVFILTDDQDKHLDSLAYMPLVRKYLAEQGTSYEKHFCTTAICCPSRVSLWTGKLAHNTNVTDVSPPYGGYPKFISQGFNNAYLPVWLQNAGYNTYYTGKLFNAHTVDNYNAPYPAGWNGTDFLLDPHTYQYLNATYQHNHDAPRSYSGEHTSDVITAKALALLDEARQSTAPFFLGIAPIAPHTNVDYTVVNGTRRPRFTAPIPAARHVGLFPDANVPRTPNFNPATASGGSWQLSLPVLDAASVAYNDEFYRQRLRALQGVDELVEAVVEQLRRTGLLENTFVFYTADNGFHIGQHRLRPGKTCAWEEDVNVPFIVRGPGVPANVSAHMVTTHVDVVPTLLQLAGVWEAVSAAGDAMGDVDEVPAGHSGAAPVSEFDGVPVPLSAAAQQKAQFDRHEHVTVEFWGTALAEGDYGFGVPATNNTYKAVRIVSADGLYNLAYTVWCDGSHELYDMVSDAYQMDNLLAGSRNSLTIGGSRTSLSQLTARLDVLLLVLKTCRGSVCVKPWEALHPQGNVGSLKDALSPRFDAFYAAQPKVSYEYCAQGYLQAAEGAQFNADGLVYREGVSWDNWV